MLNETNEIKVNSYLYNCYVLALILRNLNEKNKVTENINFFIIDKKDYNTCEKL